MEVQSQVWNKALVRNFGPMYGCIVSDIEVWSQVWKYGPIYESMVQGIEMRSHVWKFGTRYGSRVPIEILLSHL